MVRLLFYLVGVVLLMACGRQNNTEKSFTETDSSLYKEDIYLKWPIGHFEYKSELGTYTEIWEKDDKDEIRGRGFFIKRDTLFNMKMRLVNVNGIVKMFYLVSHQNGGKETEFTLSHAENNVFIFENPFRSFPSIMSYELLGDTAIHIIERGFKEKKEKREEFIVKAIKREIF
jgi:hypothetical protein